MKPDVFSTCQEMKVTARTTRRLQLLTLPLHAWTLGLLWAQRKDRKTYDELESEVTSRASYFCALGVFLDAREVKHSVGGYLLLLTPQKEKLLCSCLKNVLASFYLSSFCMFLAKLPNVQSHSSTRCFLFRCSPKSVCFSGVRSHSNWQRSSPRLFLVLPAV